MSQNSFRPASGLGGGSYGLISASNQARRAAKKAALEALEGHEQLPAPRRSRFEETAHKHFEAAREAALGLASVKIEREESQQLEAENHEREMAIIQSRRRAKVEAERRARALTRAQAEAEAEVLQEQREVEEKIARERSAAIAALEKDAKIRKEAQAEKQIALKVLNCCKNVFFLQTVLFAANFLTDFFQFYLVWCPMNSVRLDPQLDR